MKLYRKLHLRLKQKTTLYAMLSLLIVYGFAQGITLLSAPILSRLYSPENIGQFGFIVTMLVLLLPLASLRYEYAIPLVKQVYSRHILIRLANTLVIMTSCLFAIGLLCFKLIHPQAYLTATITVVLLLIILIQGLSQVLTLQLFATGYTKQVALGKLWQSCVMIATQIVAAIFFKSWPLDGLVMGYLLGLSVNYAYLYVQVKQYEAQLNALKRVVTTDAVMFFVQRFKTLPLLSSWTGFLDGLSTLFPVLFIGPMFGARNLGLYYLIFRVFSAPMGLLEKAVREVLIKTWTDRIKQKQRISRLFIKLTLGLATIALAYFIVMSVGAQYTLLLFGETWHGAGAVLQRLSFIIALMVCVSPLSNVLIFLEKNSWAAYWQVTYILTTLLIAMLTYRFGFLPFLNYIVITWVGLYLIYWTMMLVAILRWEKRACVV